jgi:DNA-binding NarL/FixJ family response regulator
MRTTIALVDDDPIVRKSMCKLIEEELPNVMVLTYETGEQILKDVSKGLRFPVIIMDYKLDNGNTGHLYTERILAIDPGASVIGFSIDHRAKDKFIRKGAKKFIKKNAPTEILINAIKKFM